jgi:hypothetical protein
MIHQVNKTMISLNKQKQLKIFNRKIKAQLKEKAKDYCLRKLV